MTKVRSKSRDTTAGKSASSGTMRKAAAVPSHRGGTAVNWKKFPVVSPSKVYHVGDLNRPPEDRYGSYEGPGISVSECPGAWTRIAKLGGRGTFVLTRADGMPGRFVDIHKLTATQREDLLKRALERGLLQPATTFTVTIFDEGDEPGYCFFDQSSDAAAELDGLQLVDDASDEDIAAGIISKDTFRSYVDRAMSKIENGADAALVFEVGGGKLEMRRSFDAAPALQRWWNVSFSEKLYNGDFREHACLYLIESESPFDGAWWTDRMDVLALSAPRGVVTPRAQGEWTWCLRSDETDDEVDEGAYCDEGEEY